MTQNDGGDIEALLREFPSLARLEDGRVRCALTGHVMAPRFEAVQPYVRGKKYAAALAKDKHMESLKEFEPHIVRSKYHPDKLFCRITGRLVQAKESAVVQHSTGKRFERGIELLTSGEGKLLDERPPEELLAERERSEEARKVASEAKRRAAAEAAAARKREAKVPDEDDESEEKIDPKVAAERERIRVNGGFSKEMGCWVPPAHVLESESESDESESESESGSDAEFDEFREGSDSEDDVLNPEVRMPNLAKIMNRVKKSGKKSRDAPVAVAEGKQRGEVTAGGGDAFDWTQSSGDERAGVGGKKVTHKAATSAGVKRSAEGGVKRGKKASSKPAVRRRT